MSNVPETRPAPAAVRPLSSAERRALRARAHLMSPTVMIGDAGLTEAIITETERSIAAHGLIKVRVFGDDRAAREAFAHTLCDRLACSLVQIIGKLLVLWRPTAAELTARTTRTREAAQTPKKLAAVGKTTSRRAARNTALRAAEPAAPPRPPRVPGLARRAGPGIRSARGALDPNAQPRRPAPASPARPAGAPRSPARPQSGQSRQGLVGVPREPRGASGSVSAPRPPAPRRSGTAATRSARPAPRTRAGRSGR